MRHGSVVGVVILLLAIGPVVAQETTGSIEGTVTSEDGKPLPGVTVQFEDLQRGLRRSTVSDRTGDYVVGALPPALYQLTANLQGFKSVKRSVRVALGHAVSSDIEMKMGEFTDEIEVSDEAPILDTTSTVAGFNANTDDLLSMVPVQREITQVAMLAPGTLGADNLLATT